MHVVCPSCSATLTVPEKFAGRKVACGACRAVVNLTPADDIPMAATVAPTPRHGPPPPPPPPSPHRDEDETPFRDEEPYRPVRAPRRAGGGAGELAGQIAGWIGMIIGIGVAVLLILMGAGARRRRR